MARTLIDIEGLLDYWDTQQKEIMQDKINQYYTLQFMNYLKDMIMNTPSMQSINLDNLEIDELRAFAI